jgi:hypothetical protein
MVTWVLWLPALIIVLVPLGGRLWCLMCPIPSLGEWLQRSGIIRSESGIQALPARRFLGVLLFWPAWLRNPWPSLLFFMLLGTFGATLVALPAATSLLLTGLIVLAIFASVFPDSRLFCRYLCPIKSYISLYSMTGRLMARPASAQTCVECEQHYCLTGSAKGWGCPYGLCMGEVGRNNDCGLCVECVKTCAYDNVALFWRRSGWDRTVLGYGEAWQAIVMFCLAILYCFVNLGAWHQIRDWTDIIDKQNWRSFVLFGVGVWAVCLGIMPLIWYTLTRIGLNFSGLSLPAGLMFRTCCAALVPLGMSCWIAFALAVLLSMMTFVLQSLSDPFNWGWNLLGMADSRWHIYWAPAIPWLQVACILLGFTYSLRTLYHCRQDRNLEKHRLLLGMLPQGAFLWTAVAGLICFFAA